MVFQQGRSERGPEAYAFRYVEGPSDARTPLEAIFNIRQIFATFTNTLIAPFASVRSFIISW
jgi:hypothetical protein